MTPNGALLFLALASVDLFVPTRFILPAFGALPVIAFLLCLPVISIIRAVRQAVFITAPLYVFLVIVWIGVVKIAPSSVLFLSTEVPLSPTAYVNGVASRLLLFTLLIAGLVQRFSASGAVAFVQQLSLPTFLKTIMLTTLSLKHTIGQAAQRAHTAFVAARVLTPGASWNNLHQGWRLIQGVWMSTLNMSLERLDTKWCLEGLPENFALRLDFLTSSLDLKDVFWITLAIATFAFAIILG